MGVFFVCDSNETVKTRFAEKTCSCFGVEHSKLLHTREPGENFSDLLPSRELLTSCGFVPVARLDATRKDTIKCQMHLVERFSIFFSVELLMESMQ